MGAILTERLDKLCFVDPATAIDDDETEVIPFVFRLECLEFVGTVVEHSYDNDYRDNDSGVSLITASESSPEALGLPVEDLTFVCADKNLADVAQSMKLPAINPTTNDFHTAINVKYYEPGDPWSSHHIFFRNTSDECVHPSFSVKTEPLADSQLLY